VGDGVARNIAAREIWVLVGGMAAALHVAGTAKPDPSCLQGTGTAGHAGIISLVPEACNALVREGLSHISVFVSGGIVDGRSVAAALVLVAQGVVIGTRFLASHEVTVPPEYKAAVLEAQDGGQVTTRSKLFDDQLRDPNIWSELYDGRSLVMQSHKDLKDGVSLEDAQKAHDHAVGGEGKGFNTGLRGRAAVWTGTGADLVTEMQGTGEIVKRVREEAKRVLAKFVKFQAAPRFWEVKVKSNIALDRKHTGYPLTQDAHRWTNNICISSSRRKSTSSGRSYLAHCTISNRTHCSQTH
jgi:nitronate monooxygenase